MTDDPLETRSRPEPGRLRSLDALRGLDMSLILGGREAILAIAGLFASEPAMAALDRQFHHPEWNGFTLYDLIFPLFLFLAGVSMPLSMEKRVAAGATKASLTRHALRRGAVLVLFGAIYNGLLGLDFERVRYASVLGRIGLAWMVAALLWIHLPRRAVVAAGVGFAAAHGLALVLVTAPGLGLEGPSLEPGETISCWVDRKLVPGRLHEGVRDPEGLFGVLPAATTALLGALAGAWLTEPSRAAGPRIGGLVAIGGQCLVLGWLLDALGLPINKNLWTASFVLWAGGWSFLLLAVFHWAFDVVRMDRLATVFMVVGANSILAYMMSAFISWQSVAELLLAKGIGYDKLHESLLPLAGLVLLWLILGVLYRRRIFLRV
ncbi:MAG: DUF5009 domain-containing protein [Planctomycetota bacterium]|nr:DUF5009 domain-containing protein [Planctomycetota bacterium]